MSREMASRHALIAKDMKYLSLIIKLSHGMPLAPFVVAWLGVIISAVEIRTKGRIFDFFILLLKKNFHFSSIKAKNSYIQFN
jgi:hypothetical protein